MAPTTSLPSLAALVTPYIPPSACTPSWATTSLATTSTSYNRYSSTSHNKTWSYAYRTYTETSTYEVQHSITTDPACQPTGYANGGPEHLYSFSPAVCPGGWIYHGMTTAFAGQGKTWSEAWCCASGFDFRGTGRTEYLDMGVTAACVADVMTYLLHHTVSSLSSASDDGDGGGGSSSSSSSGLVNGTSTSSIVHETTTPTTTKTTDPWTTTTIFGSELPSGISAAMTYAGSRTRAIHNAWHVSWEASDTSTLSPSLPSLTNGMYVPTWTPGQVIPPGMYDEQEQEHGVPGLASLFYFLCIGLPLIVIAIAACGGYCCCKGRAGKKASLASAAPLAVPKTPLGQGKVDVKDVPTSHVDKANEVNGQTLKLDASVDKPEGR